MQKTNQPMHETFVIVLNIIINSSHDSWHREKFHQISIANCEQVLWLSSHLTLHDYQVKYSMEIYSIDQQNQQNK